MPAPSARRIAAARACARMRGGLRFRLRGLSVRGVLDSGRGGTHLPSRQRLRRGSLGLGLLVCALLAATGTHAEPAEPAAEPATRAPVEPAEARPAPPVPLPRLEPDAADAAAPPDVSARPPRSALALAPDRLDRLPGADEAEVRALWRRASRLEAELRLADAAAVYERLLARLPGSAAPHWRLARVHWRSGDAAANEDRETKLVHYRKAVDWSELGIEVDPRCAECMLWRYASLGRLTMAEGLLSGLRRARTMSDMLDRAIALEPGWSDNDWNSTLGNLYYARAIWNRMVPEWWFLPLVAGVKGDKRQALQDIEQAVALHPERIDYRVEKGAILLCLGTDHDETEHVREGRAVLRETLDLDPRIESDAKDLAFARVLLREPDKACGYSRDGFVDIDGVKGKL